MLAGEDPDARRTAGLSKSTAGVLAETWTTQTHYTHTCIGSRPRLSYKLAAVRRTLRTNDVLPGKKAQRQRKQENRVPDGTRKHRSTCPANGVAFLQRQAAPEAEERQRKAAQDCGDLFVLPRRPDQVADCLAKEKMLEAGRLPG